MARNFLVIKGSRDGYSMDQIHPITVADMIEYLNEYNDDLLVVISNDGGYSYTSINKNTIDKVYDDGISAVVIENNDLDGYDLNQINDTMTVRELINRLYNYYNSNEYLMICNDGGYTYGSIEYDSFYVDTEDEEEEEYDESYNRFRVVDEYAESYNRRHKNFISRKRL